MARPRVSRIAADAGSRRYNAPVASLALSIGSSCLGLGTRAIADLTALKVYRSRDSMLSLYERDKASLWLEARYDNIGEVSVRSICAIKRRNISQDPPIRNHRAVVGPSS